MITVSGQMDDQGVKPLPACQRCAAKSAVWLVSMTGGKVVGVGSARWKLCTGCAKAAGGSKRALRSRDY